MQGLMDLVEERDKLALSIEAGYASEDCIGVVNAMSHAINALIKGVGL